MLIDADFGFEIQDLAARIQKQIAKDGLKQAVLTVTAEGFTLCSSSEEPPRLQSTHLDCRGVDSGDGVGAVRHEEVSR